jgi:hypothetical protein
MYNLNYTPTTLEVQSWREITSGVRQQKRLNTTGLDGQSLKTTATKGIPYNRIWPARFTTPPPPQDVKSERSSARNPAGCYISTTYLTQGAVPFSPKHKHMEEMRNANKALVRKY